MKATYLKYMTEEDFLFRLNVYGTEIAKYWTKFCPKMCEEYEKENGKGSLLKRIQELSRVMMDQAAELIQEGLNRPEIDEILRPMYMYQPEMDGYPDEMEEYQDEEE